jgi:hypothetical protein
MNFILNNQENFQINSSIHSIDTRNKHHLRRPNVNLPYILCRYQNFQQTPTEFHKS